jgi:Family of unknown function (DUF5678)
MESLQSEIVDERRAQILKSFESLGAESVGVFFQGAGFPTRPLRQDFSMSAIFNSIQTLTTNYDELIARALSPSQASQRMRPRPRAMRPGVSAFRDRELEWRQTHAEELRAYANEWVALEGEEIIAHDRDPVRVFEQAKQRGISSPYIFYVESADESVVRIGL